MISRPPRYTRFPYSLFNDTEATEIYTLSLHDALPILVGVGVERDLGTGLAQGVDVVRRRPLILAADDREQDRKSTRLNSSHANISYAVFCLKTKLQSRQYLVCRLLLKKKKLHHTELID